MAERPLSEFVDRVTRALRRPPAAAPEALSAVWAQVAGPRLAAASRVVGYRGGTLTIATDSAALRGEIEAFHRPELLRRLNETLPLKVSRLRVRIG